MKAKAKLTSKQLQQIKNYVEHLHLKWYQFKEDKNKIQELYDFVYERIK